MLLPVDFLSVIERLKSAKPIKKCKLDGKPLPVVEGSMHVDPRVSVVSIKCTCRYGGGTHVIEASHPLSDRGNEVKVDGAALDGADVDLTPLFHPLSADLKATLEFEKEGEPHEFELYCRAIQVI